MGNASIYSLASDDPSRAEQIAWARFSSAQDQADFCFGWLAILCTQVEHAVGALLLLGPDADGAFAPAAVWPYQTADLRYLGPTAERVLKERKGLALASDGLSAPTRDGPARIGYPIELAGAIRGAVVLELSAGPEASLQKSLRSVHWASIWLVDMLRQRTLAEADARLDRLGIGIGVVATAVKQPRLSDSALAVANELSVKLNCDRVSVGVERGGSVDVVAISHTASFNTRMALVRTLAAAMNEAFDLEATVVLPPADDAPPGALAHADLLRDQRDVAVCSTPLRNDAGAMGVLTFERAEGAGFDAETIALCETLGSLLGPIFELKRENERGALALLRELTLGRLAPLVGRGHAGAKLVALVVLGVALFFGVYTTEYRVSARAVLEGSVQRAAVAPFDGHISQSFVRAGDVVRAGQVLASLDDRDLKLERTRLESDRAQAVGKHKQALATQDRASMMVLAAQVAELDAQVALVEDRLSRANLTAPFDGVVVSGDLSQLLDTPVERGKILFQIAPLDSYRAILEVDERDVSQMRDGQAGELLLSGLPGRPLPLSVQQITPVATSQEGRNFFRVEARLGATDGLRPGMEGVAKVEIGRRRLIWIWTHGLIDWLRIFVWKQMP